VEGGGGGGGGKKGKKVKRERRPIFSDCLLVTVVQERRRVRGSGKETSLNDWARYYPSRREGDRKKREEIVVLSQTPSTDISRKEREKGERGPKPKK